MMMGSMCLFFSVAFLFSTIKTTTTNEITTKTNFLCSFVTNEMTFVLVPCTHLSAVCKYLLRSLNFIRRQSSVIEVVRAHARAHAHTLPFYYIFISQSHNFFVCSFHVHLCASHHPTNMRSVWLVSRIVSMFHLLLLL